MAKLLNQKVFDHFRRGLGPAMVFIHTEFHVTHAVNDAIIAQNARSAQTSDQNRNWNRSSAGLRRGGSQTQTLIARGPGGSAARRQASEKNCPADDTFHSGSPQSGLETFPGSC